MNWIHDALLTSIFGGLAFLALWLGVLFFYQAYIPLDRSKHTRRIVLGVMLLAFPAVLVIVIVLFSKPRMIDDSLPNLTSNMEKLELANTTNEIKISKLGNILSEQGSRIDKFERSLDRHAPELSVQLSDKDINSIVTALNASTNHLKSQPNQISIPKLESTVEKLAIQFEKRPVQTELGSVLAALEKIDTRLDNSDLGNDRSGLGGGWILFLTLVILSIIFVVLYVKEKKDPRLMKLVKITTWTSAIVALLVTLSPLSIAVLENMEKYYKMRAAEAKVGISEQFISLIPIPSATETDSSQVKSKGIQNKSPIIKPNMKNLKTTIFIPFKNEANCNGSKGLELDPASVKFIEWLGKKLENCAVENTEKRVLVAVKGFASSSGIKTDALRDDFCRKNDNEANLNFANERRNNVLRILKRSCNKACIFTGENWKNFESMKSERRFKDKKEDGKYDPQIGMLNRRVEIQLQNLTDCNPFSDSISLQADNIYRLQP